MADSIYLGIDLGTSRTSITSSNGIRETVWSYVGYPKDHVAKKKFGGRDIIYGKEAVEGRMALHLHRPLAGGSIKKQGAEDDEETKRAVKDLLRYVVALAKVPSGNTIYSVIGAPAEARVAGKSAIIDAAGTCMDSVIVCSEPFSVAYGLDHLDDTLVVDIGAGTTDLCRLHGTMPEADDQVTHEIAGDAIDELLANLIKEAYPDAQFSINMIRSFKEKHSSVSPKMEEAIVKMPVKGKPQDFDITELVYKACYSIVPPTVEALQELIATYDPEFQAKMRANVLLGGGGCQIRALGTALEKAMDEYGGGEVTTVEEPQYAGSNGALKIAVDMPEEYWKSFETLSEEDAKEAASSESESE
jgi:rod shape-determining protein MreB